MKTYNYLFAPLFDAITPLRFQKYMYTKQAPIDGDFEREFAIIDLKCNGYSYLEFEKHLDAVIDAIEQKAESKGAEYFYALGNEIDDYVKSLNFDEHFDMDDDYYPQIVTDNMFGEVSSSIKKDMFYKLINAKLEKAKSLLRSIRLTKIGNDEIDNTVVKLQWNAKPQAVAYLMLELHKKKWIKLETLKGDLNKDRAAKQLHALFSFNTNIGSASFRNYFESEKMNLYIEQLEEENNVFIPVANM